MSWTRVLLRWIIILLGVRIIPCHRVEWPPIGILSASYYTQALPHGLRLVIKVDLAAHGLRIASFDHSLNLFAGLLVAIDDLTTRARLGLNGSHVFLNQLHDLVKFLCRGCLNILL